MPLRGEGVACGYGGKKERAYRGMRLGLRYIYTSPPKSPARHFGARAFAREPRIHIHGRWLWIPDSLASLGFRNDELWGLVSLRPTRAPRILQLHSCRLPDLLGRPKAAGRRCRNTRIDRAR